MYKWGKKAITVGVIAAGITLGITTTANADWHSNSGQWQYYNSQNQVVKGWVQDSGHWYYTDNNGTMLSGWQQVSGRWYYLNPNVGSGHQGELMLDWQNINGKWYYFDDNSGQMATGWQHLTTSLGPQWYYFGDDGAMREDWQQINGQWYYLDDNDGHMYTNWKQIVTSSGNCWYYFNESGQMLTGWQKLTTSAGNCWYYFAQNGRMYTGTNVIDGTTYNFADDGHMLEQQEDTISYAAAQTAGTNAFYAGADTYYPRQCTSFVAGILQAKGVPSSEWKQLGNGNEWGAKAAAKGINVNQTPTAGSVAYFSYMHVAYVTSVNDNGTVNIIEGNYSGKPFNARTISASEPAGYIHF